MNARTVDVAIHRLRAINAEMEDLDPAHWLPEHTLHGYVDPLLRALGWEPSDPEECRPFRPAAGLAGYVLFAVPETLNTTGPHVVVVASSQGDSLPQSSTWTDLCPESEFQVVVISNGTDWLVYDAGRLMVEIDVLRTKRGEVSRMLYEWLGKSAFR